LTNIDSYNTASFAGMTYGEMGTIEIVATTKMKDIKEVMRLPRFLRR